MCAFTSASVSFVIRTTKEICSFFIMSDVIPHLTSAICTEQKSRKHILFAVACFGWTAFCLFLYKFLHVFKHFTLDNRFVNILKDRPTFLWVRYTSLIFEVLGICFEVNNITAVFLLGKHFCNSGFTPLVRIALCFLTTSAKSFRLPICHRYKHFVFLKNSGDGFIALTLNTHFEYTSDNLCRFLINNPKLRIIGRFHIPIRRLR